MTEGILERWLEELVATPGLTAIADRGARLVAASPRMRSRRPLSSAGARGQWSTWGREAALRAFHSPSNCRSGAFTLLEAERRKCAFLTRWARELPNVEVIWGRAEEQAVDSWGVALAKALAKPPVAAELCLPLVRPGGVAILWVGETADPERVAAVAARLSAELEQGPPGLLVLRKLGPTPPGFPRRPGIAKKRPLA